MEGPYHLLAASERLERMDEEIKELNGRLASARGRATAAPTRNSPEASGRDRVRSTSVFGGAIGGLIDLAVIDDVVYVPDPASPNGCRLQTCRIFKPGK